MDLARNLPPGCQEGCLWNSTLLAALGEAADDWALQATCAQQEPVSGEAAGATGAAGAGVEKPLDTKDTAQGRCNPRRMQKRAAKPFPPVTSLRRPLQTKLNMAAAGRGKI